MAKGAWIVWKHSSIESTSHETLKELQTTFEPFPRDDEASFIFSCSNLTVIDSCHLALAPKHCIDAMWSLIEKWPVGGFQYVFVLCAL